MEYEVFIVDATETPIERPLIKINKKNKKEIKEKEYIKELLFWKEKETYP